MTDNEIENDGDAAVTLNRQVGAIAAPIVVRCLRDHYGMEAEVAPLRGERDTNFLVLVDGAASYVLRIANPAEPRVLADFRAAALQHIEHSARSLPVPRIRPTLAGEPGFELQGVDGRRFGQLVSYLPGTPMASLRDGTRQCRHLGEVAARMALALQAFDHPGARHALLWDIGQAAQAMRYVHHTGTPEHKAIVSRVLMTFVERVAPVLAGLRAQVIHNDLNPHNILTSEDGKEVVGIIDFGDIVHSALVNDVAVACSYLIRDASDPLGPICDFLTAYCDILPLEERELELLPDLVATRLALTVVITNWRAALHPDNASYILRNQQGAIRGLLQLSALEPGAVRDRFMVAALGGTRR